MPRILAERSAIKKLSADTRANGFGNYITSLFRWKRISKAKAQLIALNNSGLEVESNKMYLSEDIPEDEFKLSELATLTTEFQTSGDYFEVFGVDAYMQMTPAEYAQEVPEGVPHRLDAEGQPITWSEWKKPQHSHLEFEGNFYVPCDSQGPLALSQLIALNQNFTVKSFRTFPSVQDSEV